MTENGWFQIFLYFLAVLLVTKPVGVFLYRVFEKKGTFLDFALRPIERLIYRATGVDEQKEMGWKEYGVAMLLFSGVSLVLLYVIETDAGVAAVESAEVRERGAGPGMEYGSVVHDEHELAIVFRRIDDELPDADGRPGVSQLRFGGGGHCAGHCADPGSVPAGIENDRKFLGGYDQGVPVGAAAG